MNELVNTKVENVNNEVESSNQNNNMEEVRKIFATASAGKDGKSTTLLFEEE